MSDSLSNLRGKMRCIVEFRFPVEPRFLDIRGNVIAAIHPRVRERLPSWVSQPGSILFGDKEGNPTDQFFLGTSRVSVILEDPGTLQRFEDTAADYLGYAYDSLLNLVPKVDRVGVRFIQLMRTPSLSSFEAVRVKVLGAFHVTPPGLDVKYTDSLVRLVHEQGAFNVGPAKSNEPWVDKVFGRPNNGTPEFGLALDVDSAAYRINIKRKEDVVRSFRAVLDLTKATELALVDQLGLPHD